MEEHRLLKVLSKVVTWKGEYKGKLLAQRIIGKVLLHVGIQIMPFLSQSAVTQHSTDCRQIPSAAIEHYKVI